MAEQPPVGHSFLIIEYSRSYSDTPQSFKFNICLTVHH